jgi:hypothetical protein
VKKKVVFLILFLVIVITGCTNSANSMEKPTGRGYVNLCISDPAQAGYWHQTDDVLWNTPESSDERKDRTIVTGFSSCDNVSVTIWEYSLNGNTEWNHVTLQTKDGRSYDGWLVTSHILPMSNETGTEWSNNYSSIIGLWDRTGQGNGAKIWYDFKRDGTFTFNYDMMGNRDNMQDMGSWGYLGNKTYDLISNVSRDPGHTYITIDKEGKTFTSGIVYSMYPGINHSYESSYGRGIVYAKE